MNQLGKVGSSVAEQLNHAGHRDRVRAAVPVSRAARIFGTGRFALECKQDEMIDREPKHVTEGSNADRGELDLSVAKHAPFRNPAHDPGAKPELPGAAAIVRAG